MKITKLLAILLIFAGLGMTSCIKREKCWYIYVKANKENHDIEQSMSQYFWGTENEAEIASKTLEQRFIQEIGEKVKTDKAIGEVDYFNEETCMSDTVPSTDNDFGGGDEGGFENGF